VFEPHATTYFYPSLTVSCRGLESADSLIERGREQAQQPADEPPAGEDVDEFPPGAAGGEDGLGGLVGGGHPEGFLRLHHRGIDKSRTHLGDGDRQSQAREPAAQPLQQGGLVGLGGVVGEGLAAAPDGGHGGDGDEAAAPAVLQVPCRLIRGEGEARAVQRDGRSRRLVARGGLDVARARDEKDGVDLRVSGKGLLENACRVLLIGEVEGERGEPGEGLGISAQRDTLPPARAMGLRQRTTDAGGGADD